LFIFTSNNDHIIEKEVETHDTCLQSLVKSHSLNQTKLSCKIDNGLKTIATNIQKFGEIVVESMPCDMIIVRSKDKQAQMMVADISPPVSVDNIQLKLKQKTFEYWWLWSSDHCLSCKIVWFDLDYGF
jgi:hypothetical protein